MNMACFFIDFENVNGMSLDGVSQLVGSDDEILIFYSRKASSMSIALHKELENTTAKKYYINTEVGTPNALDFQLSTYLGACVQKYPEKKFYIVSRDCGYDCVCHFWRCKDVCVKRIEHLRYFC